MILSIDSARNTKLILQLDKKEQIVEHDSPREQDILISIEQFLKAEQKTWSDLTAVKVNTGPGNFTSLRLGVTIANTISFALHIPVNGLPLGKWVEPEYGMPPSITHSQN